MFQNFTEATDPANGAPRLAALRTAMHSADLTGFLIPRADAHQGEYVPARDARLAWLTGFTGSAGFCAVLPEIAGVFVDGRYRVQVKEQVDTAHFTPVNWPETKLGDWLNDHAPDNAKIGFDMWLHTDHEIKQLNEALADSGITLWPTDNLIDAIWDDQPAPPAGKITGYPVKFAGQLSSEKRAQIAATLRASDHNAAILTLPDSIAWLLNIRGTDIERNPVPLVFAIIFDTGKMQLICEPHQVADLGPDPDIEIIKPAKFAKALAAITGTVRIDPKTAPFAIASILKDAGVTIAHADDPCVLPKARKNAVEIAGTREAHLRDGAAMVEFLCWLDRDGAKPGGDEISIVKKLEHFRRATNALLDISFETICGSGPNGALPHYRVSDDSNRTLEPGDLIVIDSGGQYIDGTTDITRTVCIGIPGVEERAAFTRVLQGMIAISRARWPRGITGRDLDPLARFHLWTAGQDYDHGTGHGVGTYLCVHEGPQRISRLSEVPLEPGMILSNEPGYYREGAFGIRTENLCVVETAPQLKGGDNRDHLSFETLTFAPIQTALIDVSMLAPAEIQWLNTYHAETLKKLAPRLSDSALNWLKQATAPI